MCKFYHHLDPEKVLLNPNQNFAEIHGAYLLLQVKYCPMYLTPGGNSYRRNWAWGIKMSDSMGFIEM